MTLYTITDWLSIFALLIMLGFVGLGVAQWIRRKELSKVDSDIFVLGGFYIIVLSAYLFFEYYVINYRPVLINNFLEPSYPSSTTLLILTVISTAVIEVHRLIQKKELRNWIDFSLCTFGTLMVIGRIFSGVHWITDIIGSFLLSSALILLYVSVNQIVKEEVKKP